VENNTHDTAPNSDNPAPNGDATALYNYATQLSEVWRSARMTIMEFGSFT
jgi:hypothetical protein